MKSIFPKKKYDYKTQTIKVNYTESEINNQKLYQKVRKIRDSKSGHQELKTIFNQLKSKDTQEWLLLLEMCELTKTQDEFLFNELKDYLKSLSDRRKDFKKLILDGLKIL